MERDANVGTPAAKVTISTHTLTWSVTSVRLACRLLSSISTHTLTWSVTNVLLEDLFQNKISTHTLTWSVTYDRNSWLRL